MTPDEWDIIRRAADTAQAERDALRVLLNRVRETLADDHPMQSEIRSVLGLAAIAKGATS